MTPTLEEQRIAVKEASERASETHAAFLATRSKVEQASQAVAEAKAVAAAASAASEEARAKYKGSVETSLSNALYDLPLGIYVIRVAGDDSSGYGRVFHRADSLTWVELDDGTKYTTDGLAKELLDPHFRFYTYGKPPTVEIQGWSSALAPDVDASWEV